MVPVQSKVVSNSNSPHMQSTASGTRDQLEEARTRSRTADGGRFRPGHYAVAQGYGVFTSSKVPKAIVNKLNAALAEAPKIASSLATPCR